MAPYLIARMFRRLSFMLVVLAAPTLARAQDTLHVRPPDSTALHAAPAPPRPAPPPPWHFQVDFGFQDLGGNTDLTIGNAGFAMERRPQSRIIIAFRADARYGRSNGIEAANDQKIRARIDWNPKQVLAPFLGVDANHDEVRRLALRTQVGAGLNINLDVRDSSRTWLSGGFILEHEIYTPAETLLAAANQERYLMRFTTQRILRTGSRLELSIRLQPSIQDVADYLAYFEAVVRVALTKKLGMTTKFDWTRDTRPVPGVREEDRALTAGLSFAW